MNISLLKVAVVLACAMPVVGVTAARASVVKEFDCRCDSYCDSGSGNCTIITCGNPAGSQQCYGKLRDT
jgi:hypothetical protein